MDLIAALPVELVAAADPSARGTAPWLRPSVTAGDATAPATPFELCFALLAAPLPGGEPLPLCGKELPAQAGAAAQPALPGAAGLSVAAALGDLRRSADPLAAGVASSAPSVPSGMPAALTAAVPASAAPAAPPLDTTTFVEPPPVADLPLPVTANAPIEPEVPPPPDRAAGSSPAVQAWLDSFAGNAASGRATSVAAKLRAAASAAVSSAASPAPAASSFAVDRAAPLVADVAAAVLQRGLGRDATPITLQAVTAIDEARSGGAADWLPATGTATATSSPSASSAPLPNAPLDLRGPGWQEAFANRVQWVVDQKVGEARIRLNPPELGAVDVKISIVEDKTYVQLTTATAAARDELTHNLPRLRELFQANGLELGGASVQNGRDGRSHGGPDGAPRHAPLPLEPLAGVPDDWPVRSLRAAQGRIDVFA